MGRLHTLWSLSPSHCLAEYAGCMCPVKHPAMCPMFGPVFDPALRGDTSHGRGPRPPIHCALQLAAIFLHTQTYSFDKGTRLLIAHEICFVCCVIFCSPRMSEWHWGEWRTWLVAQATDAQSCLCMANVMPSHALHTHSLLSFSSGTMSYIFLYLERSFSTYISLTPILAQQILKVSSISRNTPWTWCSKCSKFTSILFIFFWYSLFVLE